MKRSKGKEQEYKSMKEYERKFFPKSYKKRMEDTLDVEARTFTLADEYLEKIRKKLVK